jgi:hypothetical protein
MVSQVRQRDNRLKIVRAPIARRREMVADVHASVLHRAKRADQILPLRDAQPNRRLDERRNLNQIRAPELVWDALAQSG